MAVPSYLHLGFFAEDSVGQWHSQPRVIPGPQTDGFEDCVKELLGELPAGEESDGSLYRDQHGVVSVSLWGLIDRGDLVRLILEVQSRSGCQAVESRCFSSHRIHPNCLEATLRYYADEFREEVARWQASRDDRVPSDDGG